MRGSDLFHSLVYSPVSCDLFCVVSYHEYSVQHMERDAELCGLQLYGDDRLLGLLYCFDVRHCRGGVCLQGEVR